MSEKRVRLIPGWSSMLWGWRIEVPDSLKSGRLYGVTFARMFFGVLLHEPRRRPASKA
jgi:hypothetical protein